MKILPSACCRLVNTLQFAGKSPTHTKINKTNYFSLQQAGITSCGAGPLETDYKPVYTFIPKTIVF
ncbi:MAG: hypothetical protein KA120_09295 [Candidatus Goldbacteria bacterium]|nr:hypothetical protein [Candidatus Goldiibacteriota bacterium]